MDAHLGRRTLDFLVQLRGASAIRIVEYTHKKHAGADFVIVPRGLHGRAEDKEAAWRKLLVKWADTAAYSWVNSGLTTCSTRYGICCMSRNYLRETLVPLLQSRLRATVTRLVTQLRASPSESDVDGQFKVPRVQFYVGGGLGGDRGDLTDVNRVWGAPDVAFVVYTSTIDAGISCTCLLYTSDAADE